MLQMNYKLFNAARDKSAMNYQENRFDMELELNLDSNRRRSNCPRHSHNEGVRPTNLPDIHLKNTTASTVSHILSLYYKLVSLICASKESE